VVVENACGWGGIWRDGLSPGGEVVHDATSTATAGSGNHLVAGGTWYRRRSVPCECSGHHRGFALCSGRAMCPVAVAGKIAEAWQAR
jgi:hypothetical protein